MQHGHKHKVGRRTQGYQRLTDQSILKQKPTTSSKENEMPDHPTTENRTPLFDYTTSNEPITQSISRTFSSDPDLYRRYREPCRLRGPLPSIGFLIYSDPLVARTQHSLARDVLLIAGEYSKKQLRNE
jgi:hypothetical protein